MTSQASQETESIISFHSTLLSKFQLFSAFWGQKCQNQTFPVIFRLKANFFWIPSSISNKILFAKLTTHLYPGWNMPKDTRQLLVVTLSYQLQLLSQIYISVKVYAHITSTHFITYETTNLFKVNNNVFGSHVDIVNITRKIYNIIWQKTVTFLTTGTTVNGGTL